MLIPAVEYRRPSGERNESGWNVHVASEKEAELKTKLSQLDELGISITVENTGIGINVCLDDGQGDYKFYLWPNDAELPRRVMEMVVGFDKDDYLRWAEDQ
jgi:hypothetical protein